ncbi:MAG: hypothetical protein A3A04_02330 [Candidatus Harrisonbacteria bacterium RIFCSPLOWO2_01_FULL_40_28]|uniref:General secretion pathway GspH domain-containing protein n=2 Tax=Candidatus Harrisoniibacteriota TaxID=1817905 RepID=A0A1G1ZWH8_9BACT|nr:MAG: hypothetical protein A3A04_02330 [Candidatus Harrisonbacteria bacterium RIFCSPLOWO2_01_FULL_40_28]OGY68835.1 MAG: hypothetical protein A2586_02245 [Candidatus Harrisonbacteria bacterium RIFOXYD1_FULL_40_9]
MRESLKGFTTIEVFVSVSIIILLSSLVITYNRSGERQLIFLKERSRVFDALYRAKSLSIQTFTETDAPCGYGVHIAGNNEDFFVFKDLPAAGSDGCGTSDNKYTDESERVGSVLTLNSGVEFIVGTEALNVLFVPPEPTVVLNVNRDPLIESIRVRMRTRDGTTESAIEVSLFGQIKVE